jgi:hypothetical protein
LAKFHRAQPLILSHLRHKKKEWTSFTWNRATGYIYDTI